MEPSQSVDETKPRGRRSSSDAVTDQNHKFRYDVENAPIGQLVIALTRDFIAYKLCFTGNPLRDADLIAWSPMPDRDRAEEIRRGLLPKKPS